MSAPSSVHDAIVLKLLKEYVGISYLTDTLFRVWKGNKCGVFSTESKTLIVPTEYDRIDRLTDTLFWVWDGDEYGVFSTETGEVKWK